MSKKLICLMSLVLVLGLAAVSSAGLNDDPDLAGWWKFDGNTLDSSGNGRDGVLVGDATLVDVSILDGGVSLDGTGDYVTIPGYKGINADRTDPNNLFNPAFSVAVWVKTTDITGALVTWGSSDGTGVGGQRQSFRIDAGRLRAEHGNGNLQGATTVNDGEWHHIVQTTQPGAEGGALRPPDTLLYLDGVEETYQGAGSVNIFNLTEDNDVWIGEDASATGRYLAAQFDDVRIYSRVLDANEVAELAIRPKSWMSDPAVGSLVEDVSVLLSWTPGGYAVEHDVYFGATADLGADQLLGRQAGTTTLATGLEKNTTYYWRVDDITADGTVITGTLWNFWVPPKSAYAPSPADGVKILDTTATLSWTGGFTPIMHQVYFGTDPNEVANAAGAPLVMDIGYDTGELQPDTAYYWRVDEFYGAETVKGAVWSFSTVPVLPVTDDPNLVAQWTFDGDSGGVALDQSGNGNHVALRNGAQIVAGHGGDVLDLDATGYGAVSNLVYASTGLTEVTVSSWVRTDDPGAQYILSFDRNEYYRLAVGATNTPVTDGQVGWHVWTDAGQLDYGSVTRVDDGEWHHIAGIFDNGTATIYIDGFAEPSATLGTTYGTGNTRYGLIGANSEESTFDDGTTGGGPPILGEIDDLCIYNKAFTEDEMRQLYGNLAIAWQPQPDLGDVNDVWTMGSLSWTPGDGAVEHDVYFGTDPNAVAAADASDTTGIYRGRQTETAYVSPVNLDFDQDYYWRIDEVAADGTISTGNVWSFTTTSEIVLSDEDIPFPYDNSVDPFVSEFLMDLDPALDMSAPIARLAISYTGQAAPGSVTVDDLTGTTTVVGRGADIAGTADEFQYAYTMLTMNGSMTVKVDSFAHTHDWSKAGIMIRETLDPSSAFAAVYATGANGVRFEARAMA
ncbi:MAG TPA: LamG domain-containing protein, partial [Sedimentisphaerales bacterium]|nr:LamG domain-containing protein [Sedimentisphaerales bacterium]